MSTGVIGSPLLAIYAPGRRNMSIRHDQIVGARPGTCDTRTGGTFKVRATTAVAGSPDVPVSRRAALICKAPLLIARVAMSDASGVVEFLAVAKGPWAVVAFDHTGEYNAVIADNVFGEPM